MICTYLEGDQICLLTCVVACIESTDSFREIGIAMYRLNWYCCPQLVDPK